MNQRNMNLNIWLQIELISDLLAQQEIHQRIMKQRVKMAYITRVLLAQQELMLSR